MVAGDKILIQNCLIGDFPGGPMVKTSPFYAEDAGSIPDQGTKSPTCLTAKKNKTIQNTRVSIVTNSIKIF